MSCRRRQEAEIGEAQGGKRCLLMAGRFGKVLGMKTVTLDSFRKEPALLGSVARGEELLVTRFGKPYVRIVPASQARTFLGAGKHLGVTRPVSPDPIPPPEWKGAV